jgi:hypothetical protein
MFQRNIRFHVEICTVKSNDSSPLDTYYVTFTLITGKKKRKIKIRNEFYLYIKGQARRFKKLCEEIQTLFLTSKDRLAKQRRQTNENRPINTNNNSTTNRANASFISSIFGNTNPSCKETKKKNISHDNCSSYQ